MSCPVCFGGDDPVVRESLNAGIGVLLGVTGLVLAGFARFFMTLARRSRESAHLVGASRADSPYQAPDVTSAVLGRVGSRERSNRALASRAGAPEGTAC